MRPLWNALLVSLAVHLVLLSFWGVDSAPGAANSGVAARNLHVLSMAVNRHDTVRATAVPAPRVDRSVTPVSSRTASVIAMGPVVGSALQVAPRDIVPPATLVPSSAESSATVGAMARSQFAAESMASGEQVLPDGYHDALRGYRVALARHAKRFRRYPPAAQERGIGGRAEVELVLPLAAQPNLRIKQSSGHVELDEAALEMLRRAIEGVELPILLRAHPISISFPVEFLPPT